MEYDISVIVPTYNVENFITESLSSVINQKFNGKVELIVIDDCSTDNTLNVVNEIKDANPGFPLKILLQEKNMRQGTARNRGVQEAKGKYIFFLDGDDFLDLDALQSMFNKAEQYSCDFVLCDWAYHYEDKGTVYVNNDLFLFQEVLRGEEVEALYEANTYFSVNKLYSADFLRKNNIKYGEGYIYEDFEFYVEVAQKANTVAVVSNPYYRVRVNQYSTTKTNSNSTIHVESLLLAIKNTLAKFDPRSDYAYYHVYKYLIRKSLSYLDDRAPRGYKRKTLKKVLELLNNKNRNYPVPGKLVPLYHFFFRRKYVQNGKSNKILLIWRLYRARILTPAFSLVLKLKWGILDSKLGVKVRRRLRLKKVRSFFKRPIDKKTVLFLGFDYRYAGNSKYFFDYLKEKNTDLKLYFATKDANVPRKYRVAPRSLKFYEIFGRSNIVIFESWIPLDFIKREDATWIQLWHGTPIKKLFFDSHEIFISSFNRNHKRNKQKDITRWNYLLADSTGAVDKLASAFAYDKSDILNYGYPRVQWLRDNLHNHDKKNEIKSLLGVPKDKKVILYTPTWRDYNYKNNNPDLSYLLDVRALEKHLSDEYVILYKEHSMGKYQSYNKNVIVPDENIELQNLILISDVVLSDFSSIIFDAIAIDIPFYLYITDFEKYSHARGIYEDMDKALRPFYVESEMELSKKIMDINTDYPREAYDSLKSIYADLDKESNSNHLLEEKINEIIRG